VTPPIWLLVLLVGMAPFTMQVLIPVMPAIGEETGAGQAGAPRSSPAPHSARRCSQP
jgi:hypothetical protein